MDSPQVIGFGATISAPHMHAAALKELEPFILQKPFARVLDVGSGSGYLTACLSELVRADGCKVDWPSRINIYRIASQIVSDDYLGRIYQGCVVGVDHVPELVDWSQCNIRHDGKGHLLATSAVEESAEYSTVDKGNALPPITLVAGDGYAGWPKGAPYDAIHLGAAVESIPGALFRQLKVTLFGAPPITNRNHTVVYLNNHTVDGRNYCRACWATSSSGLRARDQTPQRNCGYGVYFRSAIRPSYLKRGTVTMVRTSKDPAFEYEKKCELVRQFY